MGIRAVQLRSRIRQFHGRSQPLRLRTHVPCGREGEGLHLPPVPEALNRACPPIWITGHHRVMSGDGPLHHFACTQQSAASRSDRTSDGRQHWPARSRMTRGRLRLSPGYDELALLTSALNRGLRCSRCEANKLTPVHSPPRSMGLRYMRRITWHILAFETVKSGTPKHIGTSGSGPSRQIAAPRNLVAKGDMRTSTGGRLLRRATLDPKRASDSGAVAIATIKSVPLGKVRECRRKGQCVYLFVSLDWLWHGWSCRPRKLIVGASLGSSRTPDLTELVRGSM
jgi:hypothetical protein